MDPKLAKAALEALKNDDKEAALALLEQLITTEITGEAGDDGEPPPDAGATAENADQPPPDPNAPPAPAPDKKQEEMAALSRELVTLSGRDAGEALAYFRDLHASAAQRSADAAVLEAGERRGLVAELVQLGVETPALAWQRDAAGEIPSGDARVPVKRLADEPIADLRSRVTVLRAVRGKTAPAAGNGPRPPAPAAPVITLTKAEQDYCAREKITPEQFAARKASAVKRSK